MTNDDILADTTAEQAVAQIEAGHLAFLAGREATLDERAGWLKEIARALNENTDSLVALATEETHLAEARLRGELKRTSFQLELFAGEIERGRHLQATIDHQDDAWGMGPRPDLRRMNVPLGVVGVFGASNFPFAFSVIGGDSASGLAAGCAVVHKIHGAHTRLGTATASIVIGALERAGAPAGLFSAVLGREAAGLLVEHPLIKAIGFTGSTSGGRALFDKASRRPEPIPFYGELGSINPVFVTQKAWDRRGADILTQYAASFTLGMGQFCTKPGLLFVPQMEWEALSAPLEAHLASSPLSLMLSPGLRDGFEKSLDEMSVGQGVVTLVAGTDGEVPTPTVLGADADAVRQNPDIIRTEMFGPASVVVRYRSEGEFAELVGLLEGQLTATVQGEDDDEIGDLVESLRERSGRILWNGWPTGVTVSYAQEHGGPYPATTASGTTSVGTAAIARFLRPVAYQSFPSSKLPPALQDDNPWGIERRVDGGSPTVV